MDLRELEKHLRMRTIAQRHEGKQRPIIVYCRISSLLRTYPLLDLRTPNTVVNAALQAIAKS